MTATLGERDLEPNNHGGCQVKYRVADRNYVHSEEGCGVGRRVGDTLSVTYLPSDPSFATVAPPSDRIRSALVINLGGPTVLALFVILFGVRGRAAARAPRARKGT